MYILTLALVLFAYMTAWFCVSYVAKRNDVADVAWGLGFILMVWTSFYLGHTESLRGVLVCVLVSIWGIRLAWHIHARNKGKGEDYRYLAWRKQWGNWFYLRSYLQVYLLQGVLLFLISLPLFVINAQGGGPLGLTDALGVLVWLVGFTFETVGDAQLARFIQNPLNKGKLMQSGLWAYTRHPNYFGEVTLWWGIGIIALSVPLGAWGLIGPIVITYLILKVSGIPLLEKKMELHPDFGEYKRRVSMFIPLPPRVPPTPKS